ncbi:MAG: DUF1592 domain-containing protein, partial [Deltaproteobacteria bacterium]|nr:DUF1592 domain-containing protein [Deltaproteobacteria bacterium]
MRSAPGLVAMWIAGCVAIGVAGCEGKFLDPPGRPDGPRPGTPGAPPPGGTGEIPGLTGPIGSGPGAPTVESCGEPDPGPNPIRALTSVQYRNAVRELLGPSADPGDLLVESVAPDHGFRTHVEVNVASAASTDAFYAAAERVALAAVADLGAVLGCDPASAECVDGWVEPFAERAYRRPLFDEERAALRSVVDAAARESFEPRDTVAMVIEAVLQSPQFLYVSQTEVPDGERPPSVVALADHEMASRLSFFLWDAPPDESLRSAAAGSRLHTAEQVEIAARRMVLDPRTVPVVSRFFEDLLELRRLDRGTKDTSVYPDWGPEVEPSTYEELSRFVGWAWLESDARLETFLTAPTTFVNGPLARIYGVGGPSSASEWQRVDLDPAQRAGVLTQIGFLASHAYSDGSSPIARGAFLRAQLLCQVLVQPVGVNIMPPDRDPTITGRDRFSEHRDNPACSGCHDLIDPVGFAFEHYDGIGRWRDTEGEGLTVDSSGVLEHAG